jgi:hypothetical protein
VTVREKTMVSEKSAGAHRTSTRDVGRREPIEHPQFVGPFRAVADLVGGFVDARRVTRVRAKFVAIIRARRPCWQITPAQRRSVDLERPRRIS